MPRITSSIVALVLFFSTTPVLAQEEFSVPSGPSFLSGEAIDGLNCFDHYTFGSVQADLQPIVAQTVPGSEISFSGELLNGNSYPLVDGKLYVKIFRRDEATFAEGDGNEVVDQFVIAEDMVIPAAGSVPVSYDWMVPTGSEGGEYYAAYFFVTADRYNLMGLSFTDDVVGNQAEFNIVSENEMAKLSKVDTTLNGRNHHFAAYPLHFDFTEDVTVETTITNPSDTAKTVPLQWMQYAWDSMNEENLRNTNTQLVTLQPNETKTVTYTATPQQESVVYITAVTQDNQAKSYLNIRYVRDGIEETRINFPGITAFPIQAGTEQTLFACAHSTNEPLVPNNVLTLSLTDKAGNTIHEYQYEGDIAGAMSGFGNTFTTAKNINYATLTATLERNGVVVEEVTQVFDCTTIPDTECLPETEGETNGGFVDTIMQNPLISFVAVALLLTLFLILSVHRRHNMGPHITASDFSGNSSTLNTIFFLLLLPTLFFSAASVSDAKSVSWTDTEESYFAYYWNWSDQQQKGANGESGWTRAMYGPNVTITYSANLYDADTNTKISDGATISVGSKIKIVPKSFAGSDISWFGTGYSNDSPNGHWVNNAVAPTTKSCVAADSLGDYDNYITLGVYVPLHVNPPTLSYNLGGTAGASNLGNGVYQITSPGTVVASVTFSNTYGKYYYRYYDYRDNGREGCYGNATPLKKEIVEPKSYNFLGIHYRYNNESTDIVNYQLNVPSQTISFSVNAASTNQAPNPPTISGPDTCTTGVANTYSFSATDPDGDQVSYQIDWGVGAGFTSATAYVNSGQSASKAYTWGSAGTYTMKVRTKDANGSYSTVVSKSVNCTDAPAASVDLVAPATAAKNETITLSWTTSNVGACTLYGNGLPSGGYSIPVANLSSGSVDTTITATDTYTLSCGSAPEENDQATVTVENSPPTRPVINGPDTGIVGQSYEFTFTSTDPDGDQLYYWGLWDGAQIPPTIYYDSGVPAPASHAWNSPGEYEIAVRASDGVVSSERTVHRIVISDIPAAPEVTALYKVNDGGWVNGDSVTITENDEVSILWWVSSGQADSCSTDFDSSTAMDTRPGGVGVTEPAPGASSETFTITCTGPGGSGSDAVTVTTEVLPNLSGVSVSAPNVETATVNDGGEFDGVVVNVGFTNSGSEAVMAGDGKYRLTYNTGTKATHTFVMDVENDLPDIAVGETKNLPVVLNGIPFGDYYLTLEADIELSNGGNIQETNEDDNFNDRDSDLAPTDPGIELEVSPGLVRNGSPATVEWTIDTPYDGMSCALAGPGVTNGYTVPASNQGEYDVVSVTAKSEYTLSCTIDGYTFSDSATVEVVGEVEEV